MPLAAPPSRGYAEGQRLDNLDGPILWEVISGNTTGPVSSGVLDVSRFEYIGGLLWATSGVCLVTLTWYNDAAEDFLLGRRVLVLSANVANFMQLRLANLGPYLSIQVTNLGGGVFNLQAQLIGTNRYHPLEFIPVEPALISQNQVNLAASATSQFWPSDYYAGPAFVWFTGSGNNAVLEIHRLADDNTTPYVYQRTVTTSQFTVPVVLPAGAWYFQLTNNLAAAQNIWLDVIPSLTGSS